ncbi:MAG: hypothetical protein ABNH38_00085 [Tateyamaria sp.]|jgi:type I restriction enzyme R subunit|uniref:hypothetical protein n=1 Tax=Tateyamaria sp. TaxID=1929288 RepID=UPI0032DD15A5|tara:strand:- start:554 stop:781 length:228 start_codon:yes stop_codon:yes gene_type:complete
MSVQSEAQLEAALIKRLSCLGWTEVSIPDSAAMLANLRLQLEAQNDVAFSDDEFRRVVNHLEKGNVFDKAQSLRV